jgi:hypothetical protein
MNDIAAFGHRFFLFGGAILIACAILQWLARPRTQGKPSLVPLVNATAIRVFLFIVVGTLAILVGMGTIPMAGGR